MAAQWVFSSQQLNLHSGISVPLIWNIKLLNFRFPFNWYGPKYRCNWKDIDTCLKLTAPWKWRFDDCQIMVVIFIFIKAFWSTRKMSLFQTEIFLRLIQIHIYFYLLTPGERGGQKLTCTLVYWRLWLFQDCAVGLLFALLPVLGGNSGLFQGIISMARL